MVASVTLTDTKTAEQLGETALGLTKLPIRLCLGYAPDDLLDVDVLFLSPGVPPYAQIVRDARARGLPISSEPRLFTQLCQTPIVGITGSSGQDDDHRSDRGDAQGIRIQHVGRRQYRRSADGQADRQYST